MAEGQPKTDTVMYFMSGATALSAECTLSITKGDDLMTDFVAVQDGVRGSIPNFFEVHEFEFGLSLKEEDAPDEQKGPTSLAPGSQVVRKPKPVAKIDGPFAKWRSIDQDTFKKKDTEYPLEFDKFTLKRTIDRASPIFFLNCCMSRTFTKAVLVKRKSQGGDQAPVGFMRIEFGNVLITGVDWSDGDLVQETVEFICQKMTITLRGQAAAGAVTKEKEAVMTWDPSTGDRSKGARTKVQSTGG